MLKYKLKEGVENMQVFRDIINPNSLLIFGG